MMHHASRFRSLPSRLTHFAMLSGRLDPHQAKSGLDISTIASLSLSRQFRQAFMNLTTSKSLSFSHAFACRFVQLGVLVSIGQPVILHSPHLVIVHRLRSLRCRSGSVSSLDVALWHRAPCVSANRSIRAIDSIESCF